MKTEKKAFELELIAPMLGTVPKSKEVYSKYIAGKAIEKNPDGADEIGLEVETVQDVEEKGWTGFHQDENGLFIFDYMIKGTIKSGIEAMIENGSIKKIVAYKKWIDLFLHVFPRKIHFGIMEPDGVLERPLRAMTAQGPRVSLARSDTVNDGRTIKFELELFKNTKGLTLEAVETALGFGKYVGLGQWRGSGGYGRFIVK